VAAVLLGLVMAAAPVRPALADPDAASEADRDQTSSQAGDTAEPAENAAAPARPAPAAPTLMADINLTTQTMTVRADGRQLYHWRISSGREGYRTPLGTFRPEWMARMWYSRQYDMAPMPHAVFFKSGAAIHGTGAVGDLGNPASHGCIRLAPANAAAFYRLVRKHGLSATRFMVHGRPPPGRDRTGGRDREIAGTSAYDRYIYYGFPTRSGPYPYSSGYRRFEPPARYVPRPYDRVPLHWR